MEIVINGKKEIGEYSTVAELLKSRGLDAKLVVVELNGQIVPKNEYASAALNEGDGLELIQFVGGG